MGHVNANRIRAEAEQAAWNKVSTAQQAADKHKNDSREQAFRVPLERQRPFSLKRRIRLRAQRKRTVLPSRPQMMQIPKSRMLKLPSTMFTAQRSKRRGVATDLCRARGAARLV